MRAVTWTQVAQYIILIIAYMIPVVWLSVKITGVPLPQIMYGGVLERVPGLEKKLTVDPKELEVRKIFSDRAADAKKRIEGLPGTWETGRADAAKKVEDLKAANAPVADIRSAEKALNDYPKSADAAKKAWAGQVGANTARSAAPLPHATPFPTSKTGEAGEKDRDSKRLNFLALTLCLMVGTAALPHILMRYYTTPSVNEARQSVFWSLLFIFLLYFTAPALAVLVKFEIYNNVVGSAFANLPAWVAAWAKIDPTLMNIADVNKDGIVQLAEIALGQDIIVLATPEIAGLPYVISGLVAAGGLAAALSTADGLLLTIANALSHDLYYKMINPNASTQKRVTISKILLLVVALFAAYVTSLKPGDILFLVGAAFSLAAAAFFPALTLGVFWKRANKAGAIAGMALGLGITMYYMATRYPFFQQMLNLNPADFPYWYGIAPISSATFGIPLGILTIIVVSLLTPAPDKQTQELVEHVRYPNLRGDTLRTEAT
jgi:cation/acetate symporter